MNVAFAVLSNGQSSSGLELLTVEDQHKQASKQLIMIAAGQVLGSRVSILGAGRCEEIPLADLVERFPSIVLHDLTQSVLETGVERACITAHQAERISFLLGELNGFEDAEVEQVLAGIDDAPSLQHAMQLISYNLNKVTPTAFVLPQQADLLIASCVLSQLHIPFLSQVVAEFEQRFPEKTSALLADESWTRASLALAGRLEQAFIEMLRRSVAKDGRVYLSATTHLIQYHVADDGRFLSPGMLRATRQPTLADYVDGAFRIERQEEWWWDANPTRLQDYAGHGFRVEGAILSPL